MGFVEKGVMTEKAVVRGSALLQLTFPEQLVVQCVGVLSQIPRRFTEEGRIIWTIE